jgi:hypothetical protein
MIHPSSYAHTHDHRERERKMAKEIIIGLILCIIILETVSVAEGGNDLKEWYINCVNKCIKKCTKRCFLILCDAGCRFVYCNQSGIVVMSNGTSPGAP